MSAAAPQLPPPGAHGGDGPAVARALGLDPADLLDLSQNLNPLAPPLKPVLTRHLDAIARYPDERDATRAMAQALGTDPERVLLTNGGSEAIQLLTGILGGRVRSEPEFGLHPRSDRGPLWRSDPHSPSGRLASPHDHADVWDEAFFALATGRWTAGRVGVVVGSLTKTFACPGLRIGYVVADPEIIAACAAAQPHWPVSTLALSVLPDLLESAELRTWASGTAYLRAQLVELLEADGLEVEAADAPWVLVHEEGLRARLATRGVLVRDCTSFGLPGTARIAVPDEAGLERVASALTSR